MKDYYQILGVTHNCTQDDIKKAYRKLARSSHPDTCEGKDGTEFRKVQEAYNAIGSADKRRAYDNSLREAQKHVYQQPMSSAWKMKRDSFSPVSFENYFEQILGNVLRSSPFFYDYNEIDHQLELILTADEARTGVTIPITIPIRKNCPVCGGTIFSIFSFCEYCQGEGHVIRDITAKVEIPPQVQNHSRFRIPIDEAGVLTITIFIQ